MRYLILTIVIRATGSKKEPIFHWQCTCIEREASVHLPQTLKEQKLDIKHTGAQFGIDAGA